MSAPATGTWTSAPTSGDGTTLADRAGRRWRLLRWWLIGLVALALAIGALAVMRPAGSSGPLDPGSTRPEGSGALAAVLADQGVQVHHVTTTAEAVAAAGPGTTLLVVPASFLLPEQADALAATPGDVVLAGAGDELLRAVSEDQVGLGTWTATPPAVAVEPRCDLPAATAAGTMLLAPGLEALGPDATTCWHDGDGYAALAALTAGGRSVVAVDDTTFLRNDTVTEEGDAALALHLLGAHEDLVWFVQDPADTTSSAEEPAIGVGSLPPWAGAAGWLGVLVALVAAVWRARRVGPLVAEDLPVVVPAAESTRGRARLYRRSRSRGHAAAALRAATAEHIARRLGLARSTTPETFVDAVVRATGHDPQAVADVLYGPPPADDVALRELARRLDILESEVHRP
ncbi:DUF4350 domain-containing protein [Isoptericola jiangsuensis]|uniref:DUF4350 domain-containing protein n=1 Tax=Isoptericola jiangsuensis TaxID=548579 RepID=UPI003AAE709E